MAARFRIRTSQGQEISFASHEMFAEFVRSGDLSPDDVVYDAETREWSSALTHPVVLQIEVEAEESSAEDTETPSPEHAATAAVEDAPAGEEPSRAPPSVDIGLELAPAPDQLSPQEASAAFVKRMEAERASDLDFDEEPGIQGFRMEQGSSGAAEGLGLVDEAQEAPPRHAVQPKPAEPRGEQPSRAPRTQGARPEPTRQEQAKKKSTRKKSGAGRKYAPLLIVGAVVAAAGIYFGPELFGPAAGADAGGRPDSVALPPPPAPLIPDTEESLRGRAQERFLTTTRALLRDLPTIPEIWLHGSYLAAPSDHPEVREAWNDLLTTIRQVRAGDNERYRAGYVRALDDARVDPATRTLRLAGAVAEFQGRAAPRTAHYDRVEALATAALRGHDALAEAEGTIAYEPAATTPVSGDPVIEAVGRNAEAQALLDQVLDLMLAELDEPNGPGTAANVGEWVWEGILAAVTN